MNWQWDVDEDDGKKCEEERPHERVAHESQADAADGRHSHS